VDDDEEEEEKEEEQFLVCLVCYAASCIRVHAPQINPVGAITVADVYSNNAIPTARSRRVRIAFQIPSACSWRVETGIKDRE